MLPEENFVIGSLADQSLSPNELAALRTQQSVRPTGGRQQGWLSENPDFGLVVPRSPADYAAYALGPAGKIAGTVGKAATLGFGLALDPSEAIAGPVGSVKKGAKALSGKIGEILGLYPSSTAEKIAEETLGGGYSVHLPTGQQPTEGLMVGKYRNDDPRNLVVPKEEFTPESVRAHAATNAKALAAEDAYLGSWFDQPNNKVYLDVSRRFAPDQIRQATKFGEGTDQLALYDVGAKDTRPIGNWRNFVAGPEFAERMGEMADVGRAYLNKQPTKEWWDMHNTAFERVYGNQNLPQAAGFMASTAPVTAPRENVQMASEYMRRYLKGEPIIQPEFRIPDTAMKRVGMQMPMETGRTPNLEKSARGAIDELQRSKVRNEAQALLGDPNAVVLDRHWARLPEDPKRGIYTGTEEGVIDAKPRKTGDNDYDFMADQVRTAARERGRTPRDYSADVWTGIRETIKNTDQLFGVPHKGSAITGESKSYADHLEDLIVDKAKHLSKIEGKTVTPKELEARLSRGDADLLSTLLAGSGVLYGIYQQTQRGRDAM